MIRSNFHTHTLFCDGKNTAEEMVQQALANGFEQLGFSGHMDPDIHMDIQAYYREIRRLQKEYAGRLDILMGVELDNMYDPRCADEAEYIIGSTHFLDVDSEIPMSVDNTPEMMEQLCREFYGGDYYRLSRAYYELEAKVYDRLKCTFVGHFDLVTRFNDSMHFLDESDPRYYRPALEAMEYLVSEGLPFEINCGAYNRGRKEEMYPNRFLLKALRDMGGRILISSDAHQKELLSGGFDEAVRRAAACGFTHYLILKHDPAGRVVLEERALDLK
jgi:histidinol-phosphatase (PHP family)